MMKLVADDVGAIPLYYVALGVAYRTGITGPTGRRARSGRKRVEHPHLGRPELNRALSASCG